MRNKRSKFKLYLTGIETSRFERDFRDYLRSNCTLLELKLVKESIESVRKLVQIVPYWN